MLVEFLTYLRFCWHPEYIVYEQYHDFHREQYRGDIHIYSSEENSTFVVHIAYGVRVTIDMAAHDAAHACLTHLRGEYHELEHSPL